MDATLLAEAVSRATAWLAGQIIAALLLLAFMIYSGLELRRSTANAKCLLSLLLPLGAGLAGLAYRLAGPPRSEPAWRLALAGGLLLLVLVASLLLAVLGLLEYRRQRGRYLQGRAHALFSLALSGILLASLVFIVARTVVRRVPLPKLIQPSGGQWMVFDNYNFRFRAPGQPWIQLEAKKLNPDSLLTFVRMNPQVYFTVMAERPGAETGLNTTELLDLAKTQLQASVAQCKFLTEIPVVRNRLQGLQVEAEATMLGQKILYLHWLCVTNGYAYQLIGFGQQTDRERLVRETDALFAGFEMIDFQRQAKAEGEPAGLFESTKFHYRLRLENTEWCAWDTLVSDMPEAEFGVTHPHDVAFVVVPVCLMGLDPDPEALNAALLATMEFTYPNEHLTNRVALQQAFVRGVQFDLLNTDGDETYAYRLRLLRGQGFAYLAAGWASLSRPGAKAIIDDIFRRLEFVEPGPDPLAPQQLNTREKHTHAVVFHRLGEWYQRLGLADQSLAGFQHALELAPKDTAYLESLFQAFARLNRYREALDCLDQHTSGAAETRNLQAMRALAQNRLGQTDLALTNYARLFAAGYHQDAYFRDYVELLQKTQPLDHALAAIRQYLERKDSPEIRRFEAQLQAQKAEFTPATNGVSSPPEK